MVEIQVKQGESIESALQRFQDLCKKSGITKDMGYSLHSEKQAKRKRARNRKRPKFRMEK